MEQVSLRFGAAGAGAGALIYLAAGGVHQDLPGRETGMEAVLHHAAGRPWAAVHVAYMLAVVLWLGAFVALARTLRGPTAGLLGPLLLAAAAVGTAVQIVDYTIDGWVLSALAERWENAADAERADLLLLTWLVHRLMAGTVMAGVVFGWGLPLLLAGVALVSEPGYPAWFGWVGAAIGAGAVGGGAVRLAGAGFIPSTAIFVGLGVPLLFWLLGLGWLMWRRASAVAVDATGPRQKMFPV